MEQRTVLVVLNNSIYPGIYTFNFSLLAFRGLSSNELLEKKVSVWACSLLSPAEYKYIVELNGTWCLQGIWSLGKIRLSYFSTIGNSTKTFDEVSQYTKCRSTKCHAPYVSNSEH